MKKIALLLIMITFPLLFGCIEDTYDPLKVRRANIAASLGTKFYYSHDGTNLMGTLEARTEGWVAVGISPNSSGGSANIIIGCVKDGEVLIADEHGTSGAIHSTDKVNNIIEYSGSEIDGVTKISFTIPLNSGDKQDKILLPGKTYHIVLVKNDSDDFASYDRSSRGLTRMFLEE